MKYNNEVIERAIMEALTKKDNGLKINREELLRAIMNDSDKDFGLGRKYTEEELQYSIYIHINKKDGYKVYVGQTSKKPKDRWKNGYKNQYLGNSIKKHKWNWNEDFFHIILCYGLTQEEADALEIALIAIFKSTNKRYGYNVAHGGNSVGKHSEETKNKISNTLKGRIISEETRKKLSEVHKGHNVSEETRKKISEGHKGHNVSEETRKKLSEVHKGHNVSEETRKKLSELNKGEKHPMYGKHHTEEALQKICDASRGENNANAKKVYCDGIVFGCVKECADYYGVPTHRMPYWIRKNKIPSHFQELGLRYATEEDIETFEKYNLNKHGEKCKDFIMPVNNGNFVYCDGMIFKSGKQCAEYYGVDATTINTCLRGARKMKKEFQELGLRYATPEDIEKYPPYIEESKNEINEAINVENNYKAKVVFFNGMIFSTVKQFAKFCNVSTRTMSDWLNGKYKRPSKLLSKLLEQGLRFATQEDIEKYPPYIEEEQN